MNNRSISLLIISNLLAFALDPRSLLFLTLPKSCNKILILLSTSMLDFLLTATLSCKESISWKFPSQGIQGLANIFIDTFTSNINNKTRYTAYLLRCSSNQFLLYNRQNIVPSPINDKTGRERTKHHQ